jgi:lipooligosaccharide transport system ATP-binding protein
MQEMAIRAQGLTKCFADFVAVNDISFEIPRGTCFGFLGPNGAGKTSTMRMIGCVSPLSKGTLEVFSQSTAQKNIRSIKQRLGVVPQEDYLDHHITCYENLELYGRYFGLKPADIRLEIKRLLDFVHLEAKTHIQVRFLSGGMKRRLLIARALINSPEMILLDEPTTGLDPQARHLIWDKMRELKDKDHTLILTTHYMEEAEQLCDMLAFMDDGKIIAMGRPKDLIREHLETNAIEIFIESSQRPKLLETFSTSTQFHADLGQRLIIYTRDSGTMLTQLHHDYSGIEIRSRLTNLEDVFLKLTGHQLRENA